MEGVKANGLKILDSHPSTLAKFAKCLEKVTHEQMLYTRMFALHTSLTSINGLIPIIEETDFNPSTKKNLNPSLTFCFSIQMMHSLTHWKRLLYYCFWSMLLVIIIEKVDLFGVSLPFHAIMLATPITQSLKPASSSIQVGEDPSFSFLSVS